MERDGVSIVLALHNGSKFISEQLDSIFSQITDRDELIVMDDFSSDNSLEIVESYRLNWPNLRVFRSERNLGVVRAFEALLGLVQRDVIFLSDQDDIWIEGRLDRMVEELNENSAVAVLSNSRIYVDGSVRNEFFSEKHPPNVDSVIANFYRNNFIGCCMAFRRDVLNLALPFPKEVSMHDWWLGSCAIASGSVVYTKEPMLLYRRHSNNLSPGKRRSIASALRDRWVNAFALIALAARWWRIRLLRGG